MKDKRDVEREVIRSKVWEETAEPDNPFAAAAIYCSGYDVFGELLEKATWVEYLYLLFMGERPVPRQARLLEGLAIALANPGPRDPSIHAAMCGAVAGSTSASCLMAALGPGAGLSGGAREVATAMGWWKTYGLDLTLWLGKLSQAEDEVKADIWPSMEHPPGFDPNGANCAMPVRQTLSYLARYSTDGPLSWLESNRLRLEEAAGAPLAMSGVAAAALFDLGFDARQGEMLFLFLRLPGAAVHSLEQQGYGWRRFPFFMKTLTLSDDPGPAYADRHSKEEDQNERP